VACRVADAGWRPGAADGWRRTARDRGEPPAGLRTIRRVDNRRLAVLVAGVTTAVLAVASLSIPVGYVALSPTTPTNTLGADPGNPGHPVIVIAGTTYPSKGRLDLTTVSESPRLSLGAALVDWLRDDTSVIPYSVDHPKGMSDSQVQQMGEQEIASSKQDAPVAAFGELGLPLMITVNDVTTGSKADGLLQKGDVLTSVQGAPVDALDSTQQALRSVAPGAVVQVGLRRAGQAMTVAVTTVAASTGDGVARVARLGVDVQVATARSVTINLSDVIGPSAGMMFALGVIDALTPDDLTGGRTIAGTGTIDESGAVGPIGGIQQKVHGARNVGASVFLVPADNCDEAKAAGVKGIELVRIPQTGGLHAAHLALEAIRAGHPVTTC